MKQVQFSSKKKAQKEIILKLKNLKKETPQQTKAIIKLKNQVVLKLKKGSFQKKQIIKLKRMTKDQKEVDEDSNRLTGRTTPLLIFFSFFLFYSNYKQTNRTFNHSPLLSLKAATF